MTGPGKGPVDPVEYRRTLATYPTGVVVVTGQSAHGAVGLTIGSLVAASMSPPLVGFLPSRSSWSWARIEESGSFCINVLAEDQLATCHAFASPNGTRFDGLPWRVEATGSPVISGVLAWLDCEITTVSAAGDHWWVTGEVQASKVERHDAGALQFCRGRFGRFVPTLGRDKGKAANLTIAERRDV